VTKFEAEEIVRRSSMRWTIFRPSVIFHPGSEFMQQLADFVRRPVVPMIDGGKALLQPVSLENLAGAMARSLHMPETQGRVYEVGGPDRISFVDLVGRIASHYKVWMNTMPVSSGFLKPLIRAMQRFKTFPLTVDQMEMLVEDNVCDPEPFREAFGIEKLDSFLEALPSLLEAVERKAA
jgi:NADH dehydrogenase